MKKYAILILIIYLSLDYATFINKSMHKVYGQNAQDGNMRVERSRDIAYQGESFDSLFGAWQDIKTHSLDLLKLSTDTTEIYSGGEFLDYEKKKYSNGYVFVTTIRYEDMSVSINTQVDIIVEAAKITFKYFFIVPNNAGITQEELESIAEEYADQFTLIDNKIQIYLAGEKRLKRLYH